MPELPDLEGIRTFLNRRILGAEIQEAVVLLPTTIRLPAIADFTALLQGNRLGPVGRRDQFLLFALESGHVLAVNAMLTGRFQYCPPHERRRARTAFLLRLDNGLELRYFDPKQMGKVYLIEAERLDQIPGFANLGPEPLEEGFTWDLFRERLRRRFGQIKSLLVDETFVAGIGNAYADEILFAAGIHPYRRRTSLKAAEVDRLYDAIRSVLQEGGQQVQERLGERIEVELRDFFRVHGRGGQPCPRCGATISQITARQRLTNFCRRCQPDF